MDREVHTVHLHSTSSTSVYEENYCWDFTTVLPRVIVLDSVDEWCCSLVQCYTPKFVKPLYLCSNICEDSVAGQRRLPVLRVLYSSKTQFDEGCCPVPVRFREISTIRIFLQRADGEVPETKTKVVTHCTLQLHRIKSLAARS